MAKQKGLIKLEGQIGDLSFYKSGGEYLARTKGGVDGSRIKNDPAFARTRENGAEFGLAGKSGKLLRTALRQLVNHASDNRVATRLTTQMLKVIQADVTHARGERTVLGGDLSLLKGFEFNDASKLSAMLFVPIATTVDRILGQLAVNVPAFVPSTDLAAATGATHVRFSVLGASVDFEGEAFTAKMAESAMVEINTEEQAAIDLAVNVEENSTRPLFLILGMEFFQSVNGENYPLNNGDLNALAMVTIDLV